jgi:hemoglobin/transferrin/lactoferrin receptor protein
VLSISSPNPRDLLQPGEALGGSLAVGYSGAYDELTFNPRAYGATADGLGFALGYTGRRNDGFVDIAGRTGELDAAEEDVDAFDARLVAPLGRSGSFRLSFNSYGQDGNSSINLANEVVGPDDAVQRATRQQTLTATYDGHGEDWWQQALRANAYYTGMDLDETRPADGRVDAVEFRTIGLDVRNTAAIADIQQLTYGIELFHDREDSARDGEVNGLFPPGSQTQLGVYARDEINLAGGRLILVPGLRWDRWASSSDDAELDGRSDSRLNPKLGATVEITPGLVASVNYAEGFRAPNFQELFISGTHFRVSLGPGMTLLGLFTPNPDLAPETSRNVDVGLRFRRAGLQAGVAYYHAWVDDFIDTEVTEGFIPPGTVLLTFASENVREATLHGFEASARWDIDARWSVRANHSSPRGEDSAGGEPLGSIPPAKTVLGLEFRAPSAGAQLGLNTRIVADFDRVPEGVEPSDGYTLLDLYTSWTPAFLPDVTLRLNVDNLADAEYRVPLFGTPGTGRDVRVGAVVNLGR